MFPGHRVSCSLGFRIGHQDSILSRTPQLQLPTKLAQQTCRSYNTTSELIAIVNVKLARDFIKTNIHTLSVCAPILFWVDDDDGDVNEEEGERRKKIRPF